MGELRYGAERVVEVDDRLLAHLAPVIMNKLARGEPFPLTLEDRHRSETFWITERAHVEIVYAEPASTGLNQRWIHESPQLRSPAQVFGQRRSRNQTPNGPVVRGFRTGRTDGRRHREASSRGAFKRDTGPSCHSGGGQLRRQAACAVTGERHFHRHGRTLRRLEVPLSVIAPTTPAARRTAEAVTRAARYPSTRSGAVHTLSPVVAAAMLARTDRPRAPPICWAEFSSAEAIPAFSESTL